jgi:hypothetical protein
LKAAVNARQTGPASGFGLVFAGRGRRLGRERDLGAGLRLEDDVRLLMRMYVLRMTSFERGAMPGVSTSTQRPSRIPPEIRGAFVSDEPA